MFLNAKPIWLTDRENEMNLAAVFEARVGDLKGTELYIAASTFYRLYIDKNFVAFGPARTAKGYARVDVLSLNRWRGVDDSLLRIEVVSYNCRSLSTCLQPGFLCAELRRGDEVLAFTGKDFTARVLN